MNYGISLRSLDSASFGRFCRALRGDFAVPSARTLGRRQVEVAAELDRKVEMELAKWPHCHIGIDGWKDPQHCA